jgi:hypothetical protein
MKGIFVPEEDEITGLKMCLNRSCIICTVHPMLLEATCAKYIVHGGDNSKSKLELSLRLL